MMQHMYLRQKAGINQNYSYFPIVVDETKAHITRKYFYPIVTDFECYKDVYESAHLRNAKYIGDNILTLPIYGDLAQEDAVKILQIIDYMIKNSAEKGG